MDGTLVDTNHANFRTYKKAIEHVTNSDYGLVFNPDQRFNRTHLKKSVPDLTELEYNTIIMHKESYYEQFLPNTHLIMDTVDILFKFCKTHRTVLVTNCRKDRALITLNHFGLTDKFDHIFFRDFAKNEEKINKYQSAIFKLGVQPHLIIAFEDEETEIRDARKAGICAINPILF
jgi:HAD superfamily hydrolase (TIGR01509 family)